MKIMPFASVDHARIESFAGYVRYIWGRHLGEDEVLEVHSLSEPDGEKMGSRRGLAYPTVKELADNAEDVISRAWEQGCTTYVGCVALQRAALEARWAEAARKGERPRGRGKKRDRGTITWAWGDIDLALPGNVREGTSGARGRFCTSVEEGMSVVEWAELPEPTFWTFSGSGLYPGWALRPGEAVSAHSEDAGFVSWISARMAAAAAERGVHVDRVGDLTRVLRPIGTVNWKSGFAVGVERIAWSGVEYSLSELGWTAETAKIFAPATARSSEPHATSTVWDSMTEPLDKVPWDEVLGSKGWARADDGHSSEQRWRRPGALSASSCAVYGDAPEWLVVFSDAVGLPTGIGGLDKWRTWAWLWFGGDTSAAWRDLAETARDDSGGMAPWPRRVVEAVQVGQRMAEDWAPR